MHFVYNSELNNSIIMKLKKHMKSDDADMRDAVGVGLSPLNCSTHVSSVVRNIQ